MAELEHRLQSLREHLQPEWTPKRAQAVERSMVRRAHRRVVARKVAGATMLVLALVATGLALREVEREPQVFGLRGARVVKYEDGSVATLLDRESVVRTIDEGPGGTLTRVIRGRAFFEVTHDPSRVFRVEAGQVAVEVLGTKFMVEHFENGARVSVEQGRVRVLWDGKRVELTRGQNQMFLIGAPAPVVPAQPLAAAAPVAEPAPQVEAPAVRRVEHPAPVGWRALARAGDYQGAYAALKSAGPGALGNDTADLLLAADVARLSHHPVDAVAPLRQVVQTHRRDPRSVLAGFTLGRLLLDTMGRPGEAAEAFASARSLSPHGALAQDALAREVEARARSGNAGRAHALAEEYARRYPNGRRIQSVRRFGNLR